MRRYQIVVSSNGENTAFGRKTTLIVELEFPNEAIARRRAADEMAARGHVVDSMIVRDLGDFYKH